MDKIRFQKNIGFRETIKTRVDRYFEETGLPQTGTWRMFLKSGLILSGTAMAYVYLVFYTASLPGALLGAFLFAQGYVLIGFNIMHDGAHGAYSKRRWLNRLAGATMDLIGGSQAVWKLKHNVSHHSYPNMDGLDSNINTDGLLRLSPEQPWRPMHRYQHLYAPLVYAIFTLYWTFYSDFRTFFRGRVTQFKLPPFSRADTAMFFGTKLAHWGMLLVVPSFFHPFWMVLLAFFGVHLIAGFTTALIFILSHSMEGVAFPVRNKEGHIDNEWAVHAVETSANFAIDNPFVCWYVGGLNFQIEHHILPRVCHIHYPAISKIVQNTCREFNLPYLGYPTVRTAVRAHFRLLKALGQAPEYKTQSFPDMARAI